jgi:hypothetical protein
MKRQSTAIVCSDGILEALVLQRSQDDFALPSVFLVEKLRALS